MWDAKAFGQAVQAARKSQGLTRAGARGRGRHPPRRSNVHSPRADPDVEGEGVPPCSGC